MSHEHYAKLDSRFFIPETWKGLAVEVALALPMPAPDAAGGIGVSYPAQNGVLRDVASTSIEIESPKTTVPGKKTVFCLPKSRIWGLSVLDDGVDRLSDLKYTSIVPVGEVGFDINAGFLNEQIEIALALPTGVEGMGGRIRIEYPRQPGTMVAIFGTSVVLRYEQLSKGERQTKLMLLPKSRIWTISRTVDA